jgi:tRNA pseudouridine55 synthase
MIISDKAHNSFETVEELVTGSVLLVDKPLTWTSFDVVNRIKGFVKKNVIIPRNAQGDDQRFKIGHAGTLDPLATGLLVICTGKFTKSIDQFQGGLKEYTGTIRFGQTTPSYDLETTPEGVFPVGHLSLEAIKETALTFIGEQWQRPPIYSAKQVDGKRAYSLARKGEHVEIPLVLITVYEFEILQMSDFDVDFRIKCSKGTYIRTLANDFGERMGSGSHLIKLRRTESYPFRVEDALSVDALIARLERVSTR